MSIVDGLQLSLLVRISTRAAVRAQNIVHALRPRIEGSHPLPSRAACPRAASANPPQAIDFLVMHPERRIGRCQGTWLIVLLNPSIRYPAHAPVCRARESTLGIQCLRYPPPRSGALLTSGEGTRTARQTGHWRTRRVLVTNVPERARLYHRRSDTLTLDVVVCINLSGTCPPRTIGQPSPDSAPNTSAMPVDAATDRASIGSSGTTRR